MTQKKVRKPRPLKHSGATVAWIDDDSSIVHTPDARAHPDYARWLERAIAWQREGEQ